MELPATRTNLFDEFLKESMFDHISDDINSKILRVVCRSDLPRKNALMRLHIYNSGASLGAWRDRYIFNPSIIQEAILLTLPVDILVEAYGYMSDFQKTLFYSNGTFIILRRLNRDIKSQVPRFNMYDKLKQISGDPNYLEMLADTSQIDSYHMNHSFAESVGTLMYGLERNGVKDNFGAIRDIIRKMYLINKYVPNGVDIQSAIDIFLFVAESITVGIDPYISNKEHDYRLPTIFISNDADYTIFEKHLNLFIQACIAINTYKNNVNSEGMHFVKTLTFPLVLGDVNNRFRYYTQIKKNLSDEYRKEFIKLISQNMNIYYGFGGNNTELYYQIEKDMLKVLFENK